MLESISNQKQLLFLVKAPVSYRLGNQRRLKYAPPPDLTSNTAKPYPNPALQTFLSTQNVSAPPTILNPYESEGLAQGNNSSVQQTSCLPEQLPTSEQLSRNSSLHSSFRSSPIGTQYNSSVTSTNQNPFFESSSLSAQFPSSLSRPIPTRVLEPTTPQNTPANISFPGFAPYVNQDLPPTSNSDKEVAVIKNSNQLNSPPEFSKGSTLKTTIESTYKPTLISGETDATFTPISAAKVTEKLEHLLAEQQENSSVATPETLTEVDKTSSVTTELTKSFESQSDTLKATNEIINKSHEAKLNDVQEKAIQSGSDTWSDVFLGQESTTQSVIFPEIHTADNGLIAITPQSAKSNAHPPQQHYQVQSISMSSSTFYTDEPAEQKSSLNYVSPIQLPQQTSSSVDFYNVSKPTEQSASVFFESAKPNRFPSFSSQERNTNSPFAQPVVNATNNLPQTQENSAFSSKATDSTADVPFWNVDQASQSQVLSAASAQPTYTTSNQPVYTAPIQQPAFYNPAQFANEPPKQPIFPHSYDQRSSQQQSFQNPSFYGSNTGLQQSYAIAENNTAYSSPSVSMITSVPEPTGSATLSPVQMSINSPTNRTTPDTVSPSFQNWVRISQFKFLFYL